MELSDKTARQLFQEVKANPTRKRFGFGRKPALINIDLQKAYTAVGEFATAYETDPKQMEYVNQLARVGGLKPAVAKLHGHGSPQMVASAVEFILEGLHLNKRLNKDEVKGQTRYRR